MYKFICKEMGMENCEFITNGEDIDMVLRLAHDHHKVSHRAYAAGMTAEELLDELNLGLA